MGMPLPSRRLINSLPVPERGKKNSKPRNKIIMNKQEKKDDQAVEIISKAIAILGGGGFIYWVLTSMEII